MSEKINGTIVKIHYYNADNGYTVALFELDYRSTHLNIVIIYLFFQKVNLFEKDV